MLWIVAVAAGLVLAAAIAFVDRTAPPSGRARMSGTRVAAIAVVLLVTAIGALLLYRLQHWADDLPPWPIPGPR